MRPLYHEVRCIIRIPYDKKSTPGAKKSNPSNQPPRHAPCHDYPDIITRRACLARVLLWRMRPFKQIASAHQGAKNWAESRRAAQECLNVHPGGQEGVQAEVMIGDAYMEEEEFQEAVHAYTRAETKGREMGGGEAMDDARQKLKKAQIALEQSKKKNYYKVRRQYHPCLNSAMRYCNKKIPPDDVKAHFSSSEGVKGMPSCNLRSRPEHKRL